MRAVNIAVVLCLVLCIDYSCVNVAAKSVINSSKIVGRNEEDMRAILASYNTEGSRLCNALSQANWDVQTHVDSAEEYSPKQVSGLLFQPRLLLRN